MPVYKPPLDGLVQFSLDLVREFPALHNPYYEARFKVNLETEFADAASAERFEVKVRKLLESDDMEVVKRPIGMVDTP
jgi:hypothetical protein